MTVYATTSKLRKDQQDTIFRVTVKDQDGNVVDLSTATVKEMRFKDPDGLITTETATFVNTGTDGQIQFTDTTGGKAAKVGPWKYWARVTLGSNVGPFPSSTLAYDVYDEGED